MAAGLAVANLASAFLVDLGPASTSTAVAAFVQSGVLAVAAWGMWGARYWAVLGFQALLALQIVILSLALLRVEKLWVGAIVAVVIAALGALFWTMVRLMARIQMPERRPGAH